MAQSDYAKVEQADANEPLDGSEAGDSDNETLPRTSGDVRRHDEETLTAEEEAEELELKALPGN